MDIAVQRDPLHPTSHHWRGANLHFMGFFDEAIAEQQRCLEIDPLYSNCLVYLTHALHSLGRHEEAMTRYERLLERSKLVRIAIEVPAFLLGGNRSAALIAAYGVQGLQGAPIIEWIRALENMEADNTRGLAKFDAWATENNVDLSQYPEILAAFGAYGRIRRAMILEPWYWFPTYKGFRASPEFKTFVRTGGYLDYWRAKGFPPQCQPIGADDFKCD